MEDVGGGGVKKDFTIYKVHFYSPPKVQESLSDTIDSKYFCFSSRFVRI